MGSCDDNPAINGSTSQSQLSIVHCQLSIIPRQCFAEKPQPVAVEDQIDVGVGVVSLRQKPGQLLQIRNLVQIPRRLLVTETAVEIAADSGVFYAAGELADVIDVVGNAAESYHIGLGLAANPIGVEHPRIERRADDGAALDEPFDLIVGQLTVAGD